MPHSSPMFDSDVHDWVTRNFAPETTHILDVGGGSGRVRSVLFEYPHMDTVEIWGPYIEKYRMEDMYRKVLNADVRQINPSVFNQYHLVIFGSVLEHLTYDEAYRVLATALGEGATVLVRVPYLMEQDEEEGNPHEIHKQDDLTHDVMCERYPWLRCITRNEQRGLYFATPSDLDRQEPLRNETEQRLALTPEDCQKIQLLIATPAYSTVARQYALSLFRTQRALTGHGIASGLAISSGADVNRLRNQLVAKFIACPELTHLLFVDADQAWEPRSILRLLALGRDVSGVAIRKKNAALEFNVNFIGDHGTIEDGVLEVAELGTGFMLIRRNVIEKMFAEYPDLKITNGADEALNQHEVDHYYALFEQAIEDGEYKSGDFMFCRRWRAIGGQVHVDPVSEVVHIGSKEYRGSLELLMEDQ